MIELFYWTSANAQKVLIFLEEARLDYKLTALDVTKGQQYDADFIKLAPNSRIPVIIDDDPASGNDYKILFESGAILVYLAEKCVRFMPEERRYEILQWLFWQTSALGPIGGQVIHFKNYAPEPIDYAIRRYETENGRLLKVLDTRLETREFIVGECSIADFACFPWIYAHHRRGQITYDGLPHLARWFETMNERPAVARSYQIWADFTGAAVVKQFSDMDEDSRRILFGAHSVKDPD